MGVSKKIGVPQNGRFIMEHPIKMDDLGEPLFSETSIYFIYLFEISHIFLALKYPYVPLTSSRSPAPSWCSTPTQLDSLRHRRWHPSRETPSSVNATIELKHPTSHGFGLVDASNDFLLFKQIGGFFSGSSC